MKVPPLLMITAVIGSALLAIPSSVHGATIDFEDPPYVTGNLSAGTFIANAPFTGQGNWSSSTSSGAGSILPADASGLYAGGQALFGGTASNAAYIGATDLFVPDPVTKTITFDLMATFNEKAGVGGWTDKNNDGLFQQSEFSAYGGIATSGQFTLRGRGFGADHLTGVNAVLNNWYQVTLVYDDALFTITMSAINLTTGGSVVDLNPLGEGTSFSYTFDSSTYDPISGFNGLAVRTTGAIALDNITAVAVPEPMSTALLIVGGMAGLTLRRALNRKKRSRANPNVS